jgi:trehalose/maltose transport system substrate-binding protein
VQAGIELVRFMTRAQIQSTRQADDNTATQPVQPEVYDLPSIPDRTEEAGQRRSGVISRPSSVTGRAYEQVTAAYIAAVHSVLTGDETAPDAAAALEKRLIEITGFPAGPVRPGK